MRLLLDTNALLWLVAGDQRLGARARSDVDSAASLLVSVASLWELAIKVSLGKLAAVPELSQVLRAGGVQRLGIDDDHLSRLTTLPWHHRDPFDRLLIAQALSGGLTVLTADDAFAAYGVSVRNARS